MFSKLSLGISCLAVMCAHSLAQDRPVIKPPLQRQLESLILPVVRFRDADLVGALRYLGQKSAEQSEQKVRVSFSLDLPKGFETRNELTLDLNRVPAMEALRYLGEQAGVEFYFEGERILVQKLGSASARTKLPREVRPKAIAPKGLSGNLAKPAQSTYAGDNVHRSTGGDIQAEKSGYIPRRSMSGWSTNLDPKNVFGVNCLSHSMCKVGNCGCHWCACKKELPAPPRPPMTYGK